MDGDAAVVLVHGGAEDGDVELLGQRGGGGRQALVVDQQDGGGAGQVGSADNLFLASSASTA